MTVKECITVLQKRCKLSQAKLAEMLGYKGRSNIAEALSYKDGMGMSVATFIKWVEEMDGQVLVVYGTDGEMILDGESDL